MRLAVATLLALAAFTIRAQDIEPRAYSNAPVGVNFVIVGNVLTRGGPSFDPSLPITDAHLETNSLVVAYARVLDFGGRSGKFDAIAPYTQLDGTANYQRQPVDRHVRGFARPAFRVSINLLGAPALDTTAFRTWKQDLIVGASVQVAPPWGQYDPTRIVNISSHRWSIKPEIGVSKATGPWTLELQASGTFFTHNDDFLGDRTRSQRPVYAVQAHVIYGFASGTWLSLDGTLFAGGRSAIDGVVNDDLQQNARLGFVLAKPLNRRNSVKVTASSGVSARTHNNFDALGVAWQYRWGAGL
ncbi:transporter [Lysobacter claricitrinus]|uniref:transporter n=1 Tax=Lysobacter claricitrinus TaxID=3367728 RepID=UPI0037DB4470